MCVCVCVCVCVVLDMSKTSHSCSTAGCVCALCVHFLAAGELRSRVCVCVCVCALCEPGFFLYVFSTWACALLYVQCDLVGVLQRQKQRQSVYSTAALDSPAQQANTIVTRTETHRRVCLRVLGRCLAHTGNPSSASQRAGIQQREEDGKMDKW